MLDQANRFPSFSSTVNTGIVLNSATDTVSSVIIQPGTQASFTVFCRPAQAQTYLASLQLSVTDNQFEDTAVQLVGEGYMEDVIVENLHSLAANTDLLDTADELVLADEAVAALRNNALSFGDVAVNEHRQLLFTLRNQSKSDCYRFEWPALSLPPGPPQPHGLSSSTASGVGLHTQSEVNLAENTAISFSPRVGHLHAGCAKDITVSFRSAEPKLLRRELFAAQLCKIAFEQSVNEVKDWDDRMTLVKWVNEYGASDLAGSVATGSQRQLADYSAVNLPGSVLMVSVQFQ